MPEKSSLYDDAKNVLALNDCGSYTMPAADLYPHQWLWDSCFIAIGLRHLDVERAKMELLSLLRGQWSNGMLPNIVFNDDPAYQIDRNIWRSWLNPFAPRDVTTTGITQPPLLAEAVVRVGQKLEWPERRLWYRSIWEPLLAYHQWLYNERDPHAEGLVLQIHPWEVGMDNTPPWMAELHEHQLPSWLRLIKRSHLDRVIGLFRRDRSVSINERFSTVEALAMLSVQRRLRRKAYDINRILDHSLFAIEDLAFNSIFIRANVQLRHIAKALREDLPDELDKRMSLSEKVFEELWDPFSAQYYSRDFITHKLLKVSSVATLLPLYAGNITQQRAEELVRQLENSHSFGPSYPVPSVPLNSFWFKPKLYWQGPSWVNINWLIIDGLERYGFDHHAAALRECTLEMIGKSGFYEYFDPLSGEGAGTANFSWTAALAIDLLSDH
ncbi:MAG TPA: trehalase family glycosidase [Candidatus Dormibacteraeota bacterium]|nr:trehalase family glycosidase [Candidatus Dormibacteraeota bacterium]